MQVLPQQSSLPTSPHQRDPVFLHSHLCMMSLDPHLLVIQVEFGPPKVQSQGSRIDLIEMLNSDDGQHMLQQ